MEGLGRRYSAFGPIVETTIPMNDCVCWLGDGVYDAGPARKYLIAAAKHLGIGMHEEPFDLDTLRGAQGMIVTSSSNLCLFAEEFEGKPFGGGSPEVAEALRAEVNREFTEATAV